MTTTAATATIDSETRRLTTTTVPLAAPGPGEVRISVGACGVCGADVGAVRGHQDGMPRTPGHEIAGTVDEIGAGVAGWSIGDAVAVGWFGGSCGHCRFCRRGDVVHCPERMTPGISYAGGWAESILVPSDALARIPDGLSPADAAPLGCAGVTTFNALREAGLAPGADVAVFGLGGLGHLAVQFARAMGYEVTVIARGPGRKAAAEELGAAHYIDAEEGSVGEALHVRGGTDLIICTAPTTTTVPDLLAGLRVGGGLTMIGMDGNSVSVPTTPMVMNSQTLTGHLTGSATDIEDAMRFALVNGIRPWTEIMPLEEAEQAVERMESGEARFRIVLDMSPGRGSRR